MANADLLRGEEEFCASLFDSAKGDVVKSRGQMIERKIEALEDMATKKSKASLLLHHGARFMQHMKQSSANQKNHVDEDELIALSAWRRIDRQTREAIKRKFLPDLLEIYEERVRAFIEDNSDKDGLVLNVQDPFQRLLLHGVCEFYNVTSTTMTTVRDGELWKTTTIKKRSGTGAPSRITLVSFLRMKKSGSQ